MKQTSSLMAASEMSKMEDGEKLFSKGTKQIAQNQPANQGAKKVERED